MKKTNRKFQLGLFASITASLLLFQNCGQVAFSPNDMETASAAKGGYEVDPTVGLIDGGSDDEGILSDEDYGKCPQKVATLSDIESNKFYTEIGDPNVPSSMNKFEHLEIAPGVYCLIKRSGCATHIMIRSEDFSLLDLSSIKVGHVYRVSQE